jgi:RNA-directed DNA polymerase
VQTAAVLVLESIFEADLLPEQYAYRADRSALDAVQHVHKLINTGHGQLLVHLRRPIACFRRRLEFFQ